MNVIRSLILGIVIAALMASCVVKKLMGPRLTGTCEGACDHYVECKHGADVKRCRTECPDVFGDRDSLMAFESLSCENAVEFVDGPRTANVSARRR